MINIDIDELTPDNVPALSEHIANAMIEACCVNLADSNHTSGLTTKLVGSNSDTIILNWINHPTTSIIRKWDPDNATEQGSSCIALLLIDKISNFYAVERTYKSSGYGFDFWLQSKDKPYYDDFLDISQYDARLEVSGIKKGYISDVEARTIRKINQVQRSNHLKKPAYIIIVEFGKPIIKISVDTP